MQDCHVAFIGERNVELGGNPLLGDTIGHSFFQWDADSSVGVTGRVASFFETFGMIMGAPTQEEYDEAAAAVVVDGPVEFPLAETVTLTGTTSYPAGSESEPNNRTIFKRLEESTNVHIEWTAIQSDQWGDKISLNMSNPNTLTDFIFTADFSDSNLLRYAKQGVVIALEEYIDTPAGRL